MIIYRTKSLADRYECTACGTNFSLADLEQDFQHPGLGKFTVSPVLDRCPFCNVRCDFRGAEIKHMPQAKAKDDTLQAEPQHLSRTLTQNCLSASTTVKPQVDWWKVDAWVREFGFPLPVDIINEWIN